MNTNENNGGIIDRKSEDSEKIYEELDNIIVSIKKFGFGIDSWKQNLKNIKNYIQLNNKLPSIKKEKPAENSDDTVYDITTGVPIAGTIHGAVDASDPRSTFNVIFGRNFVEDDASKKILAGKASEITKEDIENYLPGWTVNK